MDEINNEQVGELLRTLTEIISKAINVGCDEIGLHNPQSRLYMTQAIFTIVTAKMIAEDIQNLVHPN